MARLDRYPLLCQKAGNALVTARGLPMSLSGGDYPLFDGSQSYRDYRLDRDYNYRDEGINIQSLELAIYQQQYIRYAKISSVDNFLIADSRIEYRIHVCMQNSRHSQNYGPTSRLTSLTSVASGRCAAQAHVGCVSF
ncbi:hypothetical protein EVAR_20785_1 [Eumeta japonica]|uniref:Uncharacterized protein n=1 Tax=Eumeta variegata TaxID=151549 RepID=A0A4C1UDD7_EUMVA|nr:hypothetical protein EVAR_20785_1 [Eumeta japonica]